ncbi:hypothetical protein [Sphingomonas sp. GM_Shp_2]|uniref:hypothetical protein n=1 Tax=Sphingomonas sp. GM_Shp_2 TaxID=2937380 RepID=UPI002269C081|nr:hypothetical protein [Sphingomonas sp. GM_Shp_2]
MIPVFSVPGTNQVCVQDLDALGEIRQFLAFDPEHFHSVPVMAPALQKDEGEAGVLAFWSSPFEVLVGTSIELRALIAPISPSLLPDFVALEAATLLEDEQLLVSAAERVAKRIRSTSGRATFVSRAAGRRALMQHLRERAREEVAEAQKSSVEDYLSALQSDVSAGDWMNVWRQAIRLHNSTRLYDVAMWKLSTDGLRDYAYLVFNHISSRWAVNKLTEVAAGWLHRHDFDTEQWGQIYRLFFHRLSADDYPLGLNYLEYSSKEEHDHRSIIAWCEIWSGLWERGFERQTLIELAVSVQRGVPDNDFLPLVCAPLIREASQGWAYERMQHWLCFPNVQSAWVHCFIEFADPAGISEQYEAGLQWLEQMGSGSNQWIKLWEFMRSSMDQATWLGFAHLWLARARKDLKSWPDVFRLLVTEYGSPVTPALRHAARTWLKESRAPYYPAVIAETADLADEMLVNDQWYISASDEASSTTGVRRAR